MIPAASLALALLAAPLAASPLGVWHGPGDRACAERCPEAWAASFLSPAQQAELAEAQRRGPAVRMAVRRGDVCSIMTHHDGTRPIADTRGVVALIDAPEWGWGWQLDGWAWIQIDACTNWCAREGSVGDPLPAEALSVALPQGAANAMPPLPDRWFGGSTARGERSRRGEYPVGAAPYPEKPPVDGEVPPVAPIPLPQPAWLLVAALAALAALTRRRPA